MPDMLVSLFHFLPGKSANIFSLLAISSGELKLDTGTHPESIDDTSTAKNNFSLSYFLIDGHG
jgi:hypothetical protein